MEATMRSVKLGVMKLGVMLMLGLMAGAGAAARAQEDATEAPAAAALPEAQQATKEQIAKLFEVMRLKKQMDMMLKMMPVMAKQSVQQQQQIMLNKLPAGQQLTEEQRQALNKLTTGIIEKAVAAYPMDAMIADASTVYQRHISREDADAMIGFYSSPAGQHLLDAQPVIAHEYMPLAMERMKSVTATLTDEAAKEIKEYLSTLPAKN
jgi:hypothetical protein